MPYSAAITRFMQSLSMVKGRSMQTSWYIGLAGFAFRCDISQHKV